MGNTQYTTDVKFFDSADRELYSILTFGGWPVVSHTIAPNEQIIGVYGVKSQSSYITSLGFILKVTQP